MLCITRRSGEEIVVIDKETGEEIVIAVLNRFRNQTRLGIEASKTRYTILRRELQERDRAALG